MTAGLRISVVVPTYNRRETVERLLRALCHQTLPPDAYEVVVVVDGSEDGTRELVDAFPAPYDLSAIWQPNQGRARACNVGAASAQGDLLVFVDDDMEPIAGFLEAHERAHVARPRAAVVGAALIATGPLPSPAQSYARDLFNSYYGRFADPGFRFLYTDFYSGNFSICCTVFRELGGFDEAFKEYGNEDAELALRMERLGVSLVYDARAAATQHSLKDFVALARDAISMGRTAVLLAEKHPSAVQRFKIGQFHQSPLPERLARAVLLAASRAVPTLPNLLVHQVGRFAPSRPRWRDRYFGLALDYFFWFGVRTARDGKGLPARRS